MKKHLLAICWTLSMDALAQQVPDTVNIPLIASPAYSKGAGPIVMIDEAHHNFHTAVARFRPFALLLERDGYRIRRGVEKFSKKGLKDVRILVVSNALNARNAEEWNLPTPSAFDDNEIRNVVDWVRGGGSLFLISDHMPMPGCNEKLAAAFGFTFYNGFAFDTTKQPGPDYFSLANKRLINDGLTQGLDTILTFTGQGFDIPPAARPLLVLDDKFKLWISDTAWVFNKRTKRMPAKGKYQGAYMTFGKGRVVIFGEAAMFTAQLAGANATRMGFNHPRARRNHEFLLRLIHWLDKG